MERRRRNPPRAHRGPGSPEIITLVLLIAMLAFVIVFKDSLATGVSAILSTFDTPTPGLDPARGTPDPDAGRPTPIQPRSEP